MDNNEKTSYIKVGRRCLESEQVSNNFQSLKMKDLSIPTHKKVICMFGGNTSTNDRAANGNVKINDSLLTQENRENAEIYAFFYDTEPFIGRLVRKEYQEELLLLFENTFKPMILDDKGNIKEKQGIEKVFKNLIFESHCGGAYFVNVIINLYYDVLCQKYAPAMAENMISKIQYFSYAPCDLPYHNVSGFYVLPYADREGSVFSALNLAQEENVSIDYPKGVTKKLLKAGAQQKIESAFEDTFQDTRAIAIKIGQSIFVIPNAMNANLMIGDHSIECIFKPNILKSGTDFENNAQVAHKAARIMLNSYVSDKPIDFKAKFGKIVKQIEKVPTLKYFGV